MYQFLPSQKRPLVGLVAAVCLGLSFNAQAGVVSSLQATTSAATFGAAGISNTAGPDNNSVDSWTAQYSVTGSSAVGYAFGVNYSGGGTRYAASAGGNGIFFSRASFTKTLTITNTESYTQIYDLSYFIYGGSLSVGNWPGASQTGDTGEASLLFQIYEGDPSNRLLYRDAKLTLGPDTQSNFSSIGFSAHHTQGDNYVWTDSETGSQSLGTLDAGASKTITYELIAEAVGNYQFFSNTECGYGYGDGYGGIVTTSSSYECGYGAGSSYAFLGDPDGINSQSTPALLNVTGQRYNAVPLPGTLALMGIGLASFGFARRKRN